MSRDSPDLRNLPDESPHYESPGAAEAAAMIHQAEAARHAGSIVVRSTALCRCLNCTGLLLTDCS